MGLAATKTSGISRMLAVLAAALLGAAVVRAQRQVQPWQYEGREQGVQMWTREGGRSSLGVVKVATRFALPPQPFLAVLRDIASYPRWYHDCAQTRVLRAPPATAPVRLDPAGRFVPQPLNETYLLFFVQRASMLSDRWAIIENSARVLRNGSLEISFRSRDDYPYRGPQGAVRMGVSGQWLLSPTDRAHTQVSYMVDLDLKASAPDFLVRPRVHDAAVQTLLALGARAARELAVGR